MSDELRAAAERLRRVHAGEPVQTVYESSIPRAFANMGRDENTLSNAWQDEHPADDEELVTEEWLLSIGFRLEIDEYGGADWWQLDKVKHAPSCGTWEFDSAYLPDQPTRGHVRRLLTALGVTSKP